MFVDVVQLEVWFLLLFCYTSHNNVRYVILESLRLNLL